MKYSFRVGIILSLLTVTGCSKPPGYRSDQYTSYKVQDLAQDQKIPVTTWDLLEGRAGEAEHPEEPSGHGGDSGGGEHGGSGPKTYSSLKTTVLGEVRVFLVEKNPGILRHPAIEVIFPRGGGTLDLAKYLSGQRGTFFVGFEFQSLAAATQKKVVFLSQAKRRKIGGQIFGSGCNQFFDVTDKFIQAMTVEGIKVNTTQDRHIGVLGGTFLFAAEIGGETQVAQVRVVDSQNNKLFCQEN